MSRLYRSTVREELFFVRSVTSPPRRVKGKPVGEKYGPEDRKVQYGIGYSYALDVALAFPERCLQSVCLGLGHSDL